ERRNPALAARGRILNEAGEAVGEHRGQHRFTIGQRRGLSLSLGHPVYVIGKDPATNTGTVGSRERLAVAGCEVRESNWLIDPSRFANWSPCLARYRYNSGAVDAGARLLPDVTGDTPSGRRGAFEVRFAS